MTLFLLRFIMFNTLEKLAAGFIKLLFFHLCSIYCIDKLNIYTVILSFETGHFAELRKSSFNTRKLPHVQHKLSFSRPLIHIISVFVIYGYLRLCMHVPYHLVAKPALAGLRSENKSSSSM